MRRVFEHFPQESTCPICGDNQTGQTLLVAIHGTEEEEGIIEAVPTHISCILKNIMYSKEHRLMGLEAKA